MHLLRAGTSKALPYALASIPIGVLRSKSFGIIRFHMKNSKNLNSEVEKLCSAAFTQRCIKQVHFLKSRHTRQQAFDGQPSHI